MKNNPFYEYDYGRKKNNIRVISSNKYLQDQNSVVVINSTESKIYSTESIAFHEFSTRAAPFVGSHQIFWRKGTQNDSWLSLHQNNTKFADTSQEIVHRRRKSYFNNFENCHFGFSPVVLNSCWWPVIFAKKQRVQLHFLERQLYCLLACCLTMGKW